MLVSNIVMLVFEGIGGEYGRRWKMVINGRMF